MPSTTRARLLRLAVTLWIPALGVQSQSVAPPQPACEEVTSAPEKFAGRQVTFLGVERSLQDRTTIGGGELSINACVGADGKPSDLQTGGAFAFDWLVADKPDGIDFVTVRKVTGTVKGPITIEANLLDDRPVKRVIPLLVNVTVAKP